MFYMFFKLIDEKKSKNVGTNIEYGDINLSDFFTKKVLILVETNFECNYYQDETTIHHFLF